MKPGANSHSHATGPLRSEFLDNCGIEIVSWSEGKARGQLSFHSRVAQEFGMLQGGAIVTVIDATMASAVLSAIAPKTALTSGVEVTFLRPVMTDIQCEAEVLRVGRNLAIAQAQVFDKDGKLASIGTGSFVVSEGPHGRAANELDVER